jgi:type I restriction enzyme, R subunit
MNTIKFDEDKLEKSVINLIENIGYKHSKGPSIKRESEKEVLIEEDLKKYLVKNYADLSQNEIDKILFELESFSSSDLYETNKKFYKTIVNGKIIKREDPKKNDIFLNLISKQPEKNIYRIVDQFKIFGLEKRIPDLIIYINGIPVVIFEFKSAIKVNTNIYDAYKQLKIRYMRDIPDIFKYNLFCIISDGVDNRSGSIFSSFENFYSWRRSNLDNENDAEGLKSLKTLLNGMLNKKDLIKIIFDFIYFPDNSDDEEKILCRYPQFYGALSLFNNIQKNLKPNGSGKGGTYFGATGCGKSHTMLFLSRLIMKNKSLGSPTIIFITDRTDLDDQLSKLFENSKNFLFDENISSVESRNDLKEKLKNRKSGGIFLTTIQKFSEDIGLLTERANIIVIADEAHRSQLNIEEKIEINTESFKSKFGFAKYLRDSFPNATYVGFTGTPIDATINIFGQIVETYTMTDSVEDKITVPLVREDRVAKVWGDHKKIVDIEKYYDDLVAEGANIYQIEHSKKANAKMKTVLGDDDRLDKLATDFVNHYEKRQTEKSTYNGKAMFVSSSREIAFKFYKKIIKLKPEWTKIQYCSPDEELTRLEKIKVKPSEKIKIVMTRDKDDEKDLYSLLGTKEYRKELDRQFKQEKSNFKIAIVVDMWITGFDVKFLDTIYIDKPIEKHNLIQTISRVNRKFKNKENGLIVDYIGIKKQMNLALAMFDGKDRKNITDIEESYEICTHHLKKLNSLFSEFDFTDYFSEIPINQLESLNKATEFIQSNINFEPSFMKDVMILKNSFEISSTYEKYTSKEKSLIHFYIAVRTIIFKITKKNAPDIFEINKTVKQMVEGAIKCDDVQEIYNLNDSKNKINLFDANYINKINKIKLPNTKFLLLKNLLESQLKKFKKINKMKSANFAKKLNKVIDKYNDRDADDVLVSNVIEDFSNEIIDIYSNIKIETEDFKKANISYEEKTFYEILKSLTTKYDFFYSEIKLKKLASEVKILIDEKSNFVDWNLKADSKAALKVDLILLLAKHEYPPIKRDEVFNEILAQAENFKINNSSFF